MKYVFSVILFGNLIGAVAAQDQPPPLPKIESTGGVGTVTQSQKVELTANEKVSIARAVKQSGRKVNMPPGVTAAVGSEMPLAIELYTLPDSMLATIPAAKLFKYTLVNNRVILVDPTTMRMVDVLPD